MRLSKYRGQPFLTEGRAILEKVLSMIS